MPKFLCGGCGIQYSDTASPPVRCKICEDARQFIPLTGQRWTTQRELAVTSHNGFRKVAPGLFGIVTVPQFAVGQRAFLVQTPAGNILWDCVSFLDEATVDIVNMFGGLRYIAVSHPHFYSAVVSWADAFDCPVLLHEKDREWIMDPDPRIQLWSGDTRGIVAGATLHHIGGHFPGSCVLHLADRRILLAGDTVLVAPDRKHVGFMWSIPNHMPLATAEVARIRDRLQALDFDAIYSPLWNRGDIERGAKEAVNRSACRYIDGPPGSATPTN